MASSCLAPWLLVGWLLGWLVGWLGTELLGLLGLLEGVLSFSALLEGGLDHGVPYVRRSERLTDSRQQVFDFRYVIMSDQRICDLTNYQSEDMDLNISRPSPSFAGPL